MLDLQQIQDLYEYVFEKFQSNKITSSLIYQAITYLKSSLVEYETKVKSTSTSVFLKELQTSLTSRFDDLILKEVFLMATFLDPIEGIDSIHPALRP